SPSSYLSTPTGANRNSRPSASTRTSISLSDLTNHVAPSSSLRGWVPSTPSTPQPAATPAPTPEGASSTTTHSPGASPSNPAPRRYGSGSGLPRTTISPEISCLGTD